MKIINNVIAKVEGLQNGSKRAELGIPLILIKMLLVVLLEVIQRSNELLGNRLSKKTSLSKVMLSLGLTAIVLILFTVIGTKLIGAVVILGLVTSLGLTIKRSLDHNSAPVTQESAEVADQ